MSVSTGRLHDLIPRRRDAGRGEDAVWPLALGFLLLVFGSTALIAGRQGVVRAAPWTAFVYRAVGLSVHLEGLELRGVRSRIVIEGSRKVLAVEGEIVNMRDDKAEAPALKLAVRGENGRERYAWTTPAPKARLDAGETVAFRARLVSPPDDGADVLVRFSRHEETKAVSMFKEIAQR